MLVSHLLSHSGATSAKYSSMGGMEERVTFTRSIP